MARFTVHMTFEAPSRRGPVRTAGVARLPRSGSVRYVAGEGLVAVTAVVRADTAAEAARQVREVVERDQAHHGFGPVRLLSWTTVRSVPALAGLGRRRRGGIEWWDAGGAGSEDDGDEGGTAGVREPRRPRPSPGSLSAELEEPRGA